MSHEHEPHQFSVMDVLEQRWSPRAFDRDEVLDENRLGPAFEAARWSPSSGNSQPWTFMVGFRGDDVFQTIVGTMASGNQVWAEHAGAVVANIASVVDAEGNPQSHAVYDLGQAVAHFSVQATAEGLMVHQMGGFDAQTLGRELELDSSQRVVTLMAIGSMGDPAELPEKLQLREAQPRSRKSLSEIVRGSAHYA
ncbi:MAG: nitroreductase family protein [Pontimonas sp.]|jgi:nitroreductase|nr:nitroreductase family protein [Pontimonas sp.]MDP4688660.1 nitroreductase family protein [Pontimonas sp.]MDP4816753.1 nitroreductase family protein [Pontimonas sp.]MDP4972832.1 nitroreductase family protein [Pontimonas sp.]MDP5129042.1 nitroreductase family protein [Pontimonas sp.]